MEKEQENEELLKYELAPTASAMTDNSPSKGKVSSEDSDD